MRGTVVLVASGPQCGGGEQHCEIELATWAGAHRLRFPSTQLPWCHMISEAQYLTLADTTDYTAR